MLSQEVVIKNMLRAELSHILLHESGDFECQSDVRQQLAVSYFF